MTENPNSDALLSITNVSKSFPGVKALNDVSLQVGYNSVHGIVGENGAGKSTLMKILSGVYTKDSGTIVFNGESIERTTPIESLNRGLSIIYQEFSLVNTMNVGENIFLGRFKKMGGLRNIHKKAQELLKSIGCNASSHTLVEDLSISQKQMVEIAKALSFDSKLIIMDEPSTSLTAEEIKNLSAVIANLRAKGITIIYISHKFDEIYDYCDVVTVLRDGCVIDTKPISEITREEMISKMVGRPIENEFPERPHCATETLLEIQSLTTHKLHDISFDLKKGEILGLVGLVGAGRTEIVRAIFGADKVRGHKLLLNNRPVSIKSPIDAIKNGIALISEDRKHQGLIQSFSVESNISMAALRGLAKLGFVDKRGERHMAERQIESLSIKTPSPKTVISSLSGGNQQKCIIARWMETDSHIMIMDEPTKGIDVGAKYDIYILMKQFVENGGAIIMISSELPEVLSMSNRVLTICDGHITGSFNPEITPASEIMKAVLGLAEETA